MYWEKELSKLRQFFFYVIVLVMEETLNREMELCFYQLNE